MTTLMWLPKMCHSLYSSSVFPPFCGHCPGTSSRGAEFFNSLLAWVAAPRASSRRWKTIWTRIDRIGDRHEALVEARLNWALLRTSGFIMSRRYEHALQTSRKTVSQYLPRVDQYLREQREAGGLATAHCFMQLIELTQMLERLRPRTILECGSGATSCVFAEYASRNPGVLLVSLDNSQRYLDETRNRLPVELRESIRFEHAERVVETISGTEVCYDAPSYRRHFSGRIDLVYVDGPYNESPSRPGTQMPCIDTTQLLDAGIEVCHVLFDNRLTSVKHLMESSHGLRYDAELCHWLAAERDPIWFVEPVRHHSWLRLRTAT